MNTTHKVSIGGMAFVVDDSAYGELKTYTDKLHAKFSHRTDGQEIVNDIEFRIAELLSGKLITTDQVVTLADVKDVLDRIGDPSEMDEGEEKFSEKGSYDTSSTVTRRLYRSADNRILGGVCGGLGAYLGIDPVFIRIAFVVLTLIGSAAFFGGIFPIAYIVLWIATPTAYTVSQKLEMEGKKVNVSNIEQRIREEANNLSPQVKNAGNAAIRIIGVFFKIVAIFFISIFILTGVVVSTVLFVSLFGVEPSLMGNFISINNDADFAIFNIVYSFFPNLFWFKFSLLLLFIIPTLLLIISMIKLLFNSRIKTRFVAIPLTVIWVIALFATLITGGASLKTSFGGNNSISETIKAPAPIDTLIIKSSNPITLGSNDMLITLRNGGDNSSFRVNINGDDVVHFRARHRDGFISINANNVEGSEKINSKSLIYIRPEINIEYDSNIEKPQVVVKRWATGRNFVTATDNAESMNFTAKFNGDTLLISPAVSLKLDERILKGVEVKVLLPYKTLYKLDKQFLSSTSISDAKRQNGVYMHSENNFDNDNEHVYVDTVVVK